MLKVELDQHNTPVRTQASTPVLASPSPSPYYDDVDKLVDALLTKISYAKPVKSGKKSASISVFVNSYRQRWDAIKQEMVAAASAFKKLGESHSKFSIDLGAALVQYPRLGNKTERMMGPSWRKSFQYNSITMGAHERTAQSLASAADGFLSPIDSFTSRGEQVCLVIVYRHS